VRLRASESIEPVAAPKPVYEQIADQLRAQIFAGAYEPVPDDPGRDQLPGAAEIGKRFGVSGKTALRAVQVLVSQGLVTVRSGLSPQVIPLGRRPTRWPLSQRYARARDGHGLVFGGDMQGHDVRKEILRTGWTEPPEPIAALLGAPGQVWHRQRRMFLDGDVAELSVSYVPRHIAEYAVSLMDPGPWPPGGVVGILEESGYLIERTSNEIRARLAAPHEAAALALPGSDPAQVIFEVTHVTFTAGDKPVEAVVSLRPAAGNVLTFDTAEGPGE
jgi:GntR family transcriptional regulator